MGKRFQGGLLVRRAALIIGMLFVLVLLMFPIAIAGQNEPNYFGGGRPYPLAITEVYVDFGANTIVITGENFNNGGTPDVRLGNYQTPLTVVGTPTANEIVVELPAVPDGDYVLKVSTGPTSRQKDSYDLTIGAVGPQGVKGDPGHSPVLTWSGDQIAIDGAVTGPHLTGPSGQDGHSPVLTWSGDQIAIDGAVSGPHLTGPTGDPGPPGSDATDTKDVKILWQTTDMHACWGCPWATATVQCPDGYAPIQWGGVCDENESASCIDYSTNPDTPTPFCQVVWFTSGALSPMMYNTPCTASEPCLFKTNQKANPSVDITMWVGPHFCADGADGIAYMVCIKVTQ